MTTIFETPDTLKYQLDIEADKIADFVMAGKSEFTIQSLKSNKHFTFKVNKCKDATKEMFFVSVNIEYLNYMFLGNIWTDEKRSFYKFTPSKKLKTGSETPASVIAFKFLVDRCLIDKKSHLDLVFYHHGNCCRCGRILTNPASIKSGIGPECAKRG
jgi:hypothetical protein